MKAGFDPLALGAELTPLGLRLEENLGPAEIEVRYYQVRADRLSREVSPRHQALQPEVTTSAHEVAGRMRGQTKPCR